MKKTEERKLTTAIQKLEELQASVEDRSENAHIRDALEHLKWARNSPDDKNNKNYQPTPHDIAYTAVIGNTNPVAG